MGYAYYVLADGREAGYGVEAVCDLDGCSTAIDRGLGYLCGQTPGGDEHGCGGYFCDQHLWMTTPGQMCGACADRYDADHAGDRTEERA